MKPPAMAYPNFEEPFILHTDASHIRDWVQCYTKDRMVLLELLVMVQEP